LTWFIYIPVGVAIGIMFSSAYPESAQGINDALLPTVQSIGEKLKDILVDIVKDNV
jgi:hypothetical protein